MTQFEQFLVTTQANLQILQQREAKYGGNAPVELLNQIEDHRKAIELTWQVIRGDLNEAEWQEALRPLLVTVKADAAIEAGSRVSIGDVEGGIHDTIIAGRDIIQHITIVGGEPPPPAPAPKPIVSPLPFEPETVLVSAGPFLMDGGQDSETTEYWQHHQVNLPAYKISKYPVTNEQYARFVAEYSERRPQKAGWRFTNPPSDKLNQPVIGISWYDALSYCQWLKQQTQRPYRLPTEAEWEKAAKHAPDFKGVQAIREWTSTLWGEDWRQAQFIYPYHNDGRDNLAASSTFFRIYRSGAGDKGNQRGYYAPDARDKSLGFRVVQEIINEG